MLANTVYDAGRIRSALRENATFANIPPRVNPESNPYCNMWLYPERNLIKHFFSKLQHFRRVLTRLAWLADNCLVMA